MARLNLTLHRRVRLPAGGEISTETKCQRPRKCGARDDTIPETPPHLRVLSGLNDHATGATAPRERERMFTGFLILKALQTRGLKCYAAPYSPSDGRRGRENDDTVQGRPFHSA